MVQKPKSVKTSLPKTAFCIISPHTSNARQLAAIVAQLGHEATIFPNFENWSAKADHINSCFTIIDIQAIKNIEFAKSFFSNLKYGIESCIIVTKDPSLIGEHVQTLNPILFEDLPAAIRLADQQKVLKEKFLLAHSRSEKKDRNDKNDTVESRLEYLAVLSHEIRTPLASINHLSSLLKNTTLSSQQMNYLDSIIASTDMLLALIGDILDFAQLQASKLKLKDREFNLIQVVESALDLVSVQAWRKNIDLAYTIDGNAPTMLIGDPNRLSQVLINLLTNAVKFTESGNVRIDVRRQNEMLDANTGIENNIALLFAVSDTGIGIPKENQGELFKPFSQVSTQGKRPESGTGLGLIISKQLIQLMNGNITFQSDGIPGKGSVFSFTIQCQALQINPPAVLQPNQDLFKGKRACTIGKNTLSWNLLTEQLGFWGMQVTKLQDTDSAIHHFQTKPAVDVIVIDENSIAIGEESTLQTSIDGLKTSQFLPVIVYTSVDNLLRASMKQITTSLLRRPFSLTRLFRAMEDALLYVGSNTRPQAIDGNLNILITDDDPISRAALSLHLSYLGYQADIAENGDETLVALASKPYQLLIIDLHMGMTNGIQTSRLIRETLPTENQPLIAMLTAGATTRQRVAMQKVGIDDYIEKPVSLMRIRQLLERAHMRVAGTHPTSILSAENVTIAADKAESINTKVLKELIEISRLSRGEHAGSILEVFFETVPGIIQQVKNTAEEQNFLRLKESLHALRGSCEIYGATRLVGLCKKLENEIELGNPNNILEKVTAIELELEDVKSIIRTFQHSMETREYNQEPRPDNLSKQA